MNSVLTEAERIQLEEELQMHVAPQGKLRKALIALVCGMVLIVVGTVGAVL